MIEESRGERPRGEQQDVGEDFNAMNYTDFVSMLRNKIRTDPNIRFVIVADWVDVRKTRAAKAIIDQDAKRLHIDSITIRATRKQHMEDVNAFQSGVKWEEI